MAGRPRILVVDDDADIRSLVHRALKAAGFDVTECADGASALERIGDAAIALIILDVEMPRLNGWKTLAELRARRWTQPVLMVTHVADVSSRIRGLETGADDYIAKPFDADELLARVRALLRRTKSQEPTSKPLRFDGLTVDLARKFAHRGDTPVRLTRTEFALLEVLAAHHGAPVSRADIHRAVWGTDSALSHTLDTHIWRLRRKIGDDGDEPRWILNQSGLGFSLVSDLSRTSRRVPVVESA